MSRFGGAVALLLTTVLVSTGCGMKLHREAVYYETPCEGEPKPNVEWAKCSLKGADLKGADLRGALIHNVDLREADLTGADLTGAELATVYLDDAVLFDAVLEGVAVSGGTIQKARFCKTKMPTGNLANGDC